MLYSKKMKVLESLLGMIENFPYDDPTYAKLHEDLDRIRGKFKQVSPPCVPWVGGPFSEPVWAPGLTLLVGWGLCATRVGSRSASFGVAMSGSDSVEGALVP